jgi:plasmid stability protein
VAQILIRKLEEDVKAELRRRARRHGRSTEEEVREILRNAVGHQGGVRAPLGSRLAARFGGVGLRADVRELRGQAARPADFER